VLDHSNLENLGVPTVTFVTEPFESAALTHAQIHGLPDLPFIIVPQDYLEEPSDDVVIERDADIIERVIKSISSD
jgi:hypothetical protein